MKRDFTKFKTIEELNAMFKAEDVARGLVDKVSLYGQKVAAKRVKTEAEKRHLMTVGRVKRMLAADRRGA